METVESIATEPEQRKKSLAEIMLFMEACDRGEHTPEEAKAGFEQLKTKVDGVMDYLKHLAAIEERQAADIKEMQNAKKVTKNKQERLKLYVRNALEFCNESRIEGRAYYFGLSKLSKKKKFVFKEGVENSEIVKEHFSDYFSDFDFVNTTTSLNWNVKELEKAINADNKIAYDIKLRIGDIETTETRSFLKGVITE